MSIILILRSLTRGLCYGLGLILWGKQLRAARVLLGWSQIELAKRAKVAIGTIRRMEAFEKEIVSYTSTLSKVRAAMEKGGVEFLDAGEPGVKLRLNPPGRGTK